MEVYIVASVNEDNYINVDSVWQTYGEADARAEELFGAFGPEWEVICSKVEECHGTMVL